MRGWVAVQRNHPRGSMLFRRIGGEPLGGGYITPFAQEKINSSTLFGTAICKKCFIKSAVCLPFMIMLNIVNHVIYEKYGNYFREDHRSENFAPD